VTDKNLAAQAVATESAEPDVAELPAPSENLEPGKMMMTTGEATTEKVEPKEKEGKTADTNRAGKGARRQVSISFRSLAAGALIVSLVGAVGVLTWLYVGAERKIDTQARQSENIARAEKIGLGYATNAAAMNFQDLDSWKVKLVVGTSPDLKDRLTKAAEQMKQILVPLQWNSSAQPLAAKVRSNKGGIYDVDSFVSVQTKTAQGPDALQSTATYRVTIDSNKDWQITDVGGIGAAVAEK